MAFIDADEFLVIRDINMAAMPQLLKEYTQFGALVINWQVVPSSVYTVKLDNRDVMLCLEVY